jgi:hypothetical protein
MSPGPVFEDSVGAQLLTAVLTLPPVIKERHDTLDFVNHTYIRHDVRLVIDIDGLPHSPEAQARRAALHPAWGGGVLQVRPGRVVVPLGDLDRHSRATTHITDETGEMVPLLTSSELDKLLGGGLVSFAARALPSLSQALIDHLRRIPSEAGKSLAEAGVDAQRAADIAFDTACQSLLDEFCAEGLELVKTFEFRLALAAITSAVQLVVEVDPQRGQTRLFSYSYFRPISATTTADPTKPNRGHRGVLRPILRYLRRAGSTRLKIELGPVGGCDRYQLSAESPFDTRFASARMARADVTAQVSEEIDVSQKFRISYTRASSPSPWAGILYVRLMTVYTGVARASVLASKFLFVCALAGTLRVALQSHHYLIVDETDAAASLLLLFPGVAASAVAGVAPNTLTATLQYPMRLTLWVMSLASFVLATAAAFHFGGVGNLLLWIAITTFMFIAALTLHLRKREWEKE